jgi:hypothetical protein
MSAFPRDGNEARSKTEREAKHGKNNTCDPNHSGDATIAARKVTSASATSSRSDES